MKPSFSFPFIICPICKVRKSPLDPLKKSSFENTLLTFVLFLVTVSNQSSQDTCQWVLLCLLQTILEQRNSNQVSHSTLLLWDSEGEQILCSGREKANRKMTETWNLNLQGDPNHCALEPLLLYHLPKFFLYLSPTHTISSLVAATLFFKWTRKTHH